VLASPFGEPLWSTGTAGRGAGAVTLGDDGTFAVYAGAEARWSSD
jgi:hypothetical protein